MTKIVTCAAPIAAALFKTGRKFLFKQAAIFSVALLALIEISSPLRAVETAPAPPSGPAAQAILRWFTTDRSLGCAPCTVEDNGPVFEVYYGDSTGGGPQADVLAFVYYNPFGGGNAMDVNLAYFHRDGSNYRFIKTFPDAAGWESVKGTTVRFLPSKARFTRAVKKADDPHCCATGRANYTVTLNPAPLTLPASGNAQTTLYHAPQTPAELALDNVLNIEIAAGTSLAEPTLSSLMGTNTLPAQYAALFTPALSLAVFTANNAVAQQNCNGQPPTQNGPVCDLDFDVLLCENDIPPTPILYRTISVKESNEAVIGYAWGTGNTDQGRYRLIKVDGTWKLDGINCIFPPPASSFTFNWFLRRVP
jgi:hypothetical protein